MHKKFTLNAKDIQLLVYDFDGVLTDNKVILNENGTESVIVNRSDGLAMDTMRSAGIEQMIFTTEKIGIAKKRARKLGIPIKFGLRDKKSALIDYCKNKGISLKRVIYVGNDINDLEAMKIVEYPACPSDAYDEIKAISKIVLKSRGGDGVARELMSMVIK